MRRQALTPTPTTSPLSLTLTLPLSLPLPLARTRTQALTGRATIRSVNPVFSEPVAAGIALDVLTGDMGEM